MSEETKPTIDELRQKAEQGDVGAMCDLGYAYYKVEKIEEARKWFIQSAENGNVDGLILLICLNANTNTADWSWLEPMAEKIVKPSYIKTVSLLPLQSDAKARIMYHLQILSMKINTLVLNNINIDFPGKLSHYTTMAALRNILHLPSDTATKSNSLRQYNVLYMNDPLEGRALIRFCKENKKRSILLKFYKDNNLFPEDDHGCMIYSTAFTQKADRLDLWRMYGRDGTGLCLVIPGVALLQYRGTLSEMVIGESTSGSKQQFSTGLASLYQDPKIIERNMLCNRENSPDQFKLVKVKYDKQGKLEILKDIEPVLKNIYALLKNSAARNKVSEIVRLILLDLMYTFKDSEYSTEDEYRILSLRNYNEALLDEDNKLYVESPDFLFKHKGYEIFIGPKHEDPVKTRLELEYRISKLNLSDKIKVTISQIPYR